MKTAAKNWIWFLALMGLMVAAGLWLGNSRRKELGKGFEYSLEDFRHVDPALIHYRELEPLVPTVNGISAVAVGPDGVVYVGGHNGVEIVGDKVIEVPEPVTCLTVNSEGVLFVGFTNAVRQINPDGSVNDWRAPEGNPYFTSIAVDSWYFYVADAGNRKVWKYYIAKRGGPDRFTDPSKGEDIRKFFIPSPYFDLAASNADDSLWVVNPGYHALENFRQDGYLISRWEASGMHIEGFSGCCNPTHVALLPDGGFVTSEKGLPRVKIHNADGSFRCVVAPPDRFDDEVDGLDLAVGPDEKIYVLDPLRGQVRVFEEKR